MPVFSSIGDIIMRFLGRMGRSEGGERGPEPGDGAVIHHSSGEADFDGSDGNAARPAESSNRNLPYPPERSAD
jgi:hypothetical protein